MLRFINVLIDKRVITALIVLLVLTVDQLFKNIAQSNFVTVCNDGIAFGISGNAIVFTLIVIGVLAWILIRERRRGSTIGLVLILAGGISNIVDRINYGCVRDFISILNFPSFNLADVSIFVGAIIVLIDIVRSKK